MLLITQKTPSGFLRTALMFLTERKSVHFLDFHVAIASHAGTGRDNLADDDVLLEADEVVFLALIAASVSTRVVSWKEAADRKDSVARAALVMPSRIRLATAGRPPFMIVFSFSFSKWKISTMEPGSMLVSPASSTRTLRSI